MAALISTFRRTSSGRSERAKFSRNWKRSGVRDDAVLDDLREALVELTRGQCPKGVDISHDQDGLMKCADEILAEGSVDRRLAADGTIHLREQRGRNLHIRNSAMINRRGETREISHHSAAERDDKRRAIQARGGHLITDLLQLRERLRGLARRDCHERRLESRRSQTAHDRFTKKTPGVFIRDDHAARSAHEMRKSRSETLKQTCSHDDLVVRFARSN